MMVREAFPHMPIHLSVQANAVNWATVKFWQTQGVERVILSRELSLEEIEEIRTEVPDMELEVFVHGALCMAYSGRCLLSGYINKRDPNQALAPTLAAGTTKSMKQKKTMQARSFRFRKSRQPWAKVHRLTKSCCWKKAAVRVS